MIQEFADKYITARSEFEAWVKDSTPESYKEIVKKVVEIINPDGSYDLPDPARIHEIDDGDYQGTLVYVVGETGYQPSDYWYVKVWYGSCSGCDTLEGIRALRDTEKLAQYWTLGLHIVQGLKKMGDHAGEP